MDKLTLDLLVMGMFSHIATRLTKAESEAVQLAMREYSDTLLDDEQAGKVMEYADELTEIP